MPLTSLANAAPAARRSVFGLPLFQRKGNIGPVALGCLAVIGSIPFLMAFARVLAFPGTEVPPLLIAHFVREVGAGLNEWLSLTWVPPGDRTDILYLVLFPTGALIVAMARLTFGLRVMGLRAVLIAIGLQEVGFVPSLILMAIVTGTILAIRPSMRRARLPLFARVTIIVSLTALIMVSALFIAPIVQSQAIWGVAFFSVIIVAMLAESVAKSVANDNPTTGIWRLGWTIGLSVIIALISQSTPVREVALQFPEFIISQIVAIVFIAEFFDLRLFEDWPNHIHTKLQRGVTWEPDKPRAAVVRNRWNAGVVGRLNEWTPTVDRKRSVQKIVNALRDLGYKVKVFEGDMDMLAQLKRFLPPDTRSGMPGGMVFNLATGIQGHGRHSQVPAMLELGGIAYSGPDPVAQARLSDRYLMMTVLQQSGLRVPRFELISNPHQRVELQFPAKARPRSEPDVRSISVSDAATLHRAVLTIQRDYAQETVVETIAEGREIRVALLGNDPVECFPLLEHSSRQRTCPAEIDEALAARIQECARTAYESLGCRDYARVDIRVSADGELTVVNVKWANILAARGSFARAAEADGCEYPLLIGRILQVAAARYEVRKAIRADRSRGKASVVGLTREATVE